MFRELTLEELRTVYNEHMKQDFPPQELKPLSRIEWMRERGEYECCGLFLDGALKAYAMLAKPQGPHMVLLDYLAAVRTERSSGHGSRMLEYLKSRFDGCAGILIEAEDPAFAHDENDREIREKRIRFYERSGARETGVYGDVFGTDYTVMFLAADERCGGQEEVFEEYLAIYRKLVPEKYFEKNVKVFEGKRVAE